MSSNSPAPSGRTGAPRAATRTGPAGDRYSLSGELGGCSPIGRRGGLVNAVGAAGGGLVAALCFEPVGAGWLAPVAMALLWASVARAPLRFAAFSGLCFGLAFMLVLLWWLEDSIGWAAWLGLAGALAVSVAVASVGVRAVASLPAGPVWAGAVWIGVESLRSGWPLGGMPWGRLGFTAIDNPWQPLLPYTGITGTGLLIAIGGFTFAHACSVFLRRTSSLRRTAAAGMLAGVCAAVLAGAIWPYHVPAAATTTVAAVQGGVPGDGRDLAGHHRAVTSNHVEATAVLADSLTSKQRESLVLVVWPENATAVDPVRDPVARAAIEEAVAAIGVPVLVGGIFDGPTAETAYNRGLLWRPDRGPKLGGSGVYTKTHPVPFGEHIPWRSVIGGWSSRFDRIPRDMLPGQGGGPLSVYGLLVADAICFDVAYDDVLPGQVARGGQIAVVQTSNATFTGTIQPEQQFEITRARAVELGRTVVVASTNGVSGVIASDGEVTQRATGEETATLVAEVELANRVTPAVRSQSMRSAAIPAVAVVGLLLAFARGLRRRGRGRVPTRFERSVELPKAAEVGVVVGDYLPSGAGLGAVEPTSLAPVGGDPSDDEGSGEDRERVVTQRPPQ